MNQTATLDSMIAIIYSLRIYLGHGKVVQRVDMLTIHSWLSEFNPQNPPTVMGMLTPTDLSICVPWQHMCIN